jgi:hypothetical protein
MLSSRGRNPRLRGATDPEAISRILDAAYRDAADRAIGRVRVDLNTVNPSDLLPIDLSLDPEATAIGIDALRKFGTTRK